MREKTSFAAVHLTEREKRTAALRSAAEDVFLPPGLSNSNNNSSSSSSSTNRKRAAAWRCPSLRKRLIRTGRHGGFATEDPRLTEAVALLNELRESWDGQPAPGSGQRARAPAAQGPAPEPSLSRNTRGYCTKLFQSACGHAARFLPVADSEPPSSPAAPPATSPGFAGPKARPSTAAQRGDAACLGSIVGGLRRRNPDPLLGREHLVAGVLHVARVGHPYERQGHEEMGAAQCGGLVRSDTACTEPLQKGSSGLLGLGNAAANWPAGSDDEGSGSLPVDTARGSEYGNGAETVLDEEDPRGSLRKQSPTSSSSSTPPRQREPVHAPRRAVSAAGSFVTSGDTVHPGGSNRTLAPGEGSEDCLRKKYRDLLLENDRLVVYCARLQAQAGAKDDELAKVLLERTRWKDLYAEAADAAQAKDSELAEKTAELLAARAAFETEQRALLDSAGRLKQRLHALAGDAAEAAELKRQHQARGDTIAQLIAANGDLRSRLNTAVRTAMDASSSVFSARASFSRSQSFCASPLTPPAAAGGAATALSSFEYILAQLARAHESKRLLAESNRHLETTLMHLHDATLAVHHPRRASSMRRMGRKSSVVVKARRRVAPV
ncbi:hypothetical protein DIPPA_20638 [Diplonema papillatum]|nr:hypothetical protein DIPPA_20638 [Diplonema papillatum]